MKYKCSSQHKDKLIRIYERCSLYNEFLGIKLNILLAYSIVIYHESPNT